MPERYYNPFAGIDIAMPEGFRDDFARYCQTGGRAVIDQSPFPRMVDLWFLAVCIGAAQGLKPADIGKVEAYKIIEGSIFGSDPWRIQALMLIAIATEDNLEIVAEPRRMMGIANGLAVAAMPTVLSYLKEGNAEPMWNVSDAIVGLLSAEKVAA